MHGGLFGAGRGTIDADILANQLLLLVRTDAAIGIDEPTGALGANLSVVKHIVIDFGVRIGLRLLLALPLLDRLALQRFVVPKPSPR